MLMEDDLVDLGIKTIALIGKMFQHPGIAITHGYVYNTTQEETCGGGKQHGY